MPDATKHIQDAGGESANRKRVVTHPDIATVDKEAIRTEMKRARQKHTVRVRQHILP